MNPNDPQSGKERQWLHDVLYLHSLWRQGPNPSSASAFSTPIAISLSPRPNNKIKKKRKPKKKRDRMLDLDPSMVATEAAWPCPSATPDFPSLPSWPEPPAKRAPPPLSAAECAHRSALEASQKFFSVSHEDEMDEDEDEDEDEVEEDGPEARAFRFFTRVFEGDDELRGYYEKNWKAGEFSCLVCGGVREKAWKKFRNCVGLVRHSKMISKTKRMEAHRGFARALCQVLGWEMERLPSTVGDCAGEFQADESKEEDAKMDAPPEVKEEIDVAAKLNVEMSKEDSLGVVSKWNDGKWSDPTPGVQPVSLTEAPSEVNENVSVGAHLNVETSKQDSLGNASIWPVSKWPDPIPNKDPVPLSAAMQAQVNGLEASMEFLFRKSSSTDGSDNDCVLEEDEDEMEVDDDDDENPESRTFSFFCRLFEEDQELKGYYESNWEAGEFCCLVCVAIKEKGWKRFSNCVALVQHADSICKTKRKGAHRGFAKAICQAMGWDIERLPSIILRDSHGESLEKSVGSQEGMPEEASSNMKEEICKEVLVCTETTKEELADCALIGETEALPQKGVIDKKEVPNKNNQVGDTQNANVVDCTLSKEGCDLLKEDMQRDIDGNGVLNDEDKHKDVRNVDCKLQDAGDLSKDDATERSSAD